MKSRPILFNAPMVRAIPSGRKRLTRRIVKPMKNCPLPSGDGWALSMDSHGYGGLWREELGGVSSVPLPRCPYGELGDELWVREAWGFRGTTWHGSGAPDEVLIEYLADGTRRSIEFPHDTVKSMKLPEQRRLRIDESQDDYREYLHQFWKQSRPSIFMPRWASRITLVVEDVRIERLQDISEDDAIAEGVTKMPNVEVSELSGPFHVEAEVGTWPTARDCYRELWRSINGPDSWALNPWVWVVKFAVKP